MKSLWPDRLWRDSLALDTRCQEVRMRGSDGRAGELFGYVDLARRVPTDHPLRVIRAGVNAALGELSGALASSMRVWAGRRSRPRSCWASCCCRRSIRSARSAS